MIEMTLAILAGGAGTRMGRPKALLHVNDRPILEFLLDQLDWPGPTLLVTAPGRERPPGAQRFAREALDSIEGQGPLRGILTALESASTQRALITAVDMPMIRRAHLEELVREFESRQPLLGLMTARIGSDGRRQVEPFPSIFDVAAAPVIRRRLDEPRRSVSALVEDPSFVAINPDSSWDESAWLNLNHPSDLNDLARLGLRLT
jgi:molybdopterin-guanine dinucleotide biosynthesis protein A